MTDRRDFLAMGMPIPAFFLLLLVFQLFFMPGLLRQGGQLYVPFAKIVVGGSSNNPPYEFLDDNNEPAGYLVDLTRAIAAEMKIEVEIRLDDWEQLKQDFRQGKIDLLQGMTQTDLLSGDYPFFSLAAYSQKLFASHDYPRRISTLSQLGKGTLAVSKHTPCLQKFMSENPDLHFLLVASHSEALRQLAEGQCDFALIVNLPSPFLGRELAFLQQNENGVKIFQIGELKTTLNYGYLVRNDDSYLLERINESLNNLNLSGRQKEIQQQWLGKMDSGQISKREKSVQLGGLIFSPLLLVVCTVFFWNNALKKEVARRSKEIAIQQAQLIQADKMTSLGILVSGVAHEINNPTGLILHNLSTLKRVYETSQAVLEERYEQEGDFLIGGLPFSVLREEAEDIFNEIQDGADKIIQIVEDLKDFSRKDAPAVSERVEINQVARASLRLLEGSLRKRIAGVRLELADGLPVFLGHSARIQQVVVNLLLNAFQANEEVGSGIAVKTFCNERDGEIVLEVSDQGVGIDPEHLPHLLDPFFTTKRESGGTGLGLSISDSIVKEHKGRLDFVSDPGKGTKVSLFLPINPRNAS